MKLAAILLVFLFTYQRPPAQEEIRLNDTGNIPFELLKEKVIIPVQIGNRTYRFLVDTGGIFEISEEIQNAFGFVQTQATSIIDINRIEIERKTVIVPEIKLGNYTFRDRKAIIGILHDRYPYSCFQLDGMIGRDFFDKVILQFDYAQNTFRLTEDINAVRVNAEKRTRLRVSSRGLPEVKLRINGEREYVEFDSGSGDFYSPKTSDVEKRVSSSTGGSILAFQGEFSFGVSMDNIRASKRYMEKVESFEIAGTTFNHFYSQFSKVSAARIGVGILKYGKATLDFQNGWFYYEPYFQNPDLEGFETFGFDVSIENNAYKVKWTLMGSDAHTLGLRSGTNLISIDGLSTQNIAEDCAGYLHGYAFKNKEEIKVKYLDDQNTEKTIALTKKVYE